ncbi:MAG: DUF2799 domain-containing protein [Gammaproteobacteria bacterium]|nr:DUF2799 domain-containing protein [Gammaproteobacteria bacterium]NVK86870.1 DUF2799 domain-containing protein [Gammaproteobacteria bacterium]
MKSLLSLIVLVAAMLTLQGCATLSKDECRSADWRTIGFEDGSRGYSSQRIASHREACAEYGVAPDFERYMQGHKQGIRNYCVPSRGFSLGRSGSQYNNLCPADLEPSFLTAYRRGLEVHAAEDEVRRIERDMQALDRERADLIAEVERNEKIIVSDNTTSRVRRELLEQNRVLEDLIAEKDAIYHRLEREKNIAQRRVNRLLRSR